MALLNKQQLASRIQAAHPPGPLLSCWRWELWVSGRTEPTQHGSRHDRCTVPPSAPGKPTLLCAMEQTSLNSGAGGERVPQAHVVPAAGVHAAAWGLCSLSSFASQHSCANYLVAVAKGQHSGCTGPLIPQEEILLWGRLYPKNITKGMWWNVMGVELVAWGGLGILRVAPLPRKSISGPVAPITFRTLVTFVGDSPLVQKLLIKQRDGWGSRNEAKRECGALEGTAVKINTYHCSVNNPSGPFYIHSAAGFVCRHGSANLF